MGNVKELLIENDQQLEAIKKEVGTKYKNLLMSDSPSVCFPCSMHSMVSQVEAMMTNISVMKSKYSQQELELMRDKNYRYGVDISDIDNDDTSHSFLSKTQDAVSGRLDKYDSLLEAQQEAVDLMQTESNDSVINSKEKTEKKENITEEHEENK